MGSPLAAFENALIIRSHRAKDLDEKHALAAQLHGISRFEASQRSRLLTLVTALQLLVPLERLTAELCGKDMLSVKECAEILRRSEILIRRNIAKGALRAFKRNGQWGVRPEDLKLLMTARSNN